VTSTRVEQLPRLSFDLLRTRSSDMRFAAEEIRSSMKLMARLRTSVEYGRHMRSADDARLPLWCGATA
jgi:hypothetical protein